MRQKRKDSVKYAQRIALHDPPVKTEAVNEREGSNLVVLTRIAMVEQSTVANEASVDVNGCGLRAGEDAEGVVADVSSERLREVGERASESGGRGENPVESLRASAGKFVNSFFLSQRQHPMRNEITEQIYSVSRYPTY